MIYDKYIDLKNKYLEYIIMIKVGNFYHSYDDDGIILNYLFNYKIKDNSIVGFPVSSLDKVKRRLKKENINYYIDDNNHMEFNDNKYSEVLDKSNCILELKKDIEDIYNYLNSNIERKYIKRIINKIKEVIDEG